MKRVAPSVRMKEGVERLLRGEVREGDEGVTPMQGFVCAASITFAGWRRLFLPAKGLRRGAARDLTALGNCRWLVARQ
jgi:hypothetical protein